MWDSSGKRTLNRSFVAILSPQHPGKLQLSDPCPYSLPCAFHAFFIGFTSLYNSPCPLVSSGSHRVATTRLQLLPMLPFTFLIHSNRNAMFSGEVGLL